MGISLHILPPPWSPNSKLSRSPTSRTSSQRQTSQSQQKQINQTSSLKYLLAILQSMYTIDSTLQSLSLLRPLQTTTWCVLPCTSAHLIPTRNAQLAPPEEYVQSVRTRRVCLPSQSVDWTADEAPAPSKPISKINHVPSPSKQVPDTTKHVNHPALDPMSLYSPSFRQRKLQLLRQPLQLHLQQPKNLQLPKKLKMKSSKNVDSVQNDLAFP